MKRFFVATLVVTGALACTFVAQAQEPPKDAPKEHSMTGCLAKGSAADTFTVTDLEGGKGPTSLSVVSSTANLAPHVGHKITVTGTAVPVKDAEAMTPAPPKAPHYMKITAVKMVAATCP